MFTVNDIYDEARQIVGTCDDNRFFNILSDAVSLVANKADFEGWKGYVDVCVDDRYVTLPREVQTVLAVNINGNPAVGRNETFAFHLNGPGDGCEPCTWIWDDRGYGHPTYREITSPSQLVAYVSNEADNGASVVVHGYDENNNPLWHEVGGEQRKGYPIPTVYGYAIPDSAMPRISRVTAVVKDRTKYPVRLSTIDDSGVTGVLLGVYEPDEVMPQYRRIKLTGVGSGTNWVRIAYTKVTPKLETKYDHIPLQSRLAFLLAVRAVRQYAHEDIAVAHQYEADATRLEIEAQTKLDTGTLAPPQIVDWNNLQDKTDWDIR